MNRYTFSIIADSTMPDPERFLGFWKRNDEWFFCDSVYDAFVSRKGKYTEHASLSGCMWSKSLPNASPLKISLWMLLSEGFKKSDEIPRTQWIVTSVRNCI